VWWLIWLPGDLGHRRTSVSLWPVWRANIGRGIRCENPTTCKKTRPWNERGSVEKRIWPSVINIIKVDRDELSNAAFCDSSRSHLLAFDVTWRQHFIFLSTECDIADDDLLTLLGDVIPDIWCVTSWLCSQMLPSNGEIQSIGYVVWGEKLRLAVAWTALKWVLTAREKKCLARLTPGCNYLLY
jgi:hypothetical protein